MNLEATGDPVFASRALGEGVGVVPETTGETAVLAPVSGTLKTVARTGHAFGIKTDGGIEVLVHIGIDTVDMDGEGFARGRGLKASGSRRESHWPPWISAKSRRPGTALWWW